MPMFRSIKNNPAIKSLIITVLTAVIVYSCFNIYIHVDDIGLRALVSGMLSDIPDGHNQHMNACLALFISFLYSIASNCDWQGIFVVFLGFAILWVVLYRCFEKNVSFKYVIALYVLFLTLVLRQIVIPQYTVTSLLCGVAAMIMWATSEWDEIPSKKRVAEIVFVLIMVFLAFGLRALTFYMMLPTMAILVVYKFLYVKKSKYDAVFILLSILLMGIMFCADHSIYDTDDFRQIRQIDKYRLRLVDYGPMPEFDDVEYASIYAEAGISEEELYMFTNNGGELAFCNDLSLEKFRKYNDIYYLYNSNTKLNFGNIKYAVTVAMDHIAENKYYFVADFLVFLCIIFMFAITKRYRALIFTLIIEGTMLSLWIYLGIEGRFLDRILYLLHMQSIVSMIILMIFECRVYSEMLIKLKCRKWIPSVLVVFLVISFIFEMQNISSRRLKVFDNGNETSMMFDSIRNDSEHLYLIGFTSMWEKFRVFDSHRDCNYAMCYQWLSIMPQFIQKVCDGNYKNTSEAILERDDLLVVFRSEDEIDEVVKYYKSIGINAVSKIEQIIRINDKEYFVVDFGK